MNITIGSVDVGAEIVAMLACAASAAKGGGGENDHMSCRMRDAQARFTPVLPDYAAMLAALTEMEEHVLAGLSVSGDVLARLFDAPQDQCVPAYYLYAGLQAGLDTGRAIGCICRELETEDFGVAVGQETPPMDMMTFIRRARAQGLDERYIWNLTCMLSDWDAQCAYLADLIARGEALWQEKAAQLEPLLRVWLGRMDARVETMRQTGRIAKLLKLSDREAGYRLIPSLRGFASLLVYPSFIPGAPIDVHYGVLIDEVTDALPSVMDSQLLTSLRALGDKRRLAIMRELLKRPLFASEVAQLTELSPATVSHHMAELLSVQLVMVEEVGNRVRYRANRESGRQMVSMLQSLFEEN